jgi:hypothetical protein
MRQDIRPSGSGHARHRDGGCSRGGGWKYAYSTTGWSGAGWLGWVGPEKEAREKIPDTAEIKKHINNQAGSHACTRASP